MNFDLKQGFVQFHEKDPEYRKAVIGFLSRKADEAGAGAAAPVK